MKPLNPAHLRQPGHSAPVTRAAMEARIARFRDLRPDPNAFPDLKSQGGRRSVSYVISPDATGGPAPITAAHNFHLSISELSRGIRPTVHSHPYTELFMPLDARFEVFWGEDLKESAVLEPFDIISVPPGVFRTFENLDEHPGHMLAIFDHGGDPHTGIVVPPDVFEKFYRGWVPGQPGLATA